MQRYCCLKSTFQTYYFFNITVEVLSLASLIEINCDKTFVGSIGTGRNPCRSISWTGSELCMQQGESRLTKGKFVNTNVGQYYDSCDNMFYLVFTSSV